MCVLCEGEEEPIGYESEISLGEDKETGLGCMDADWDGRTD